MHEMTKTFTITILLAFIGNIGFSQVGGTDQLRDSLKHELVIAKDDTSCVLIMTDLANAYWTTNLDSSFVYGNEALALAKRKRFSRGEASALNALGLSLQVKGDCPGSLEILDRSLQISGQNNYVLESAVSYSFIGSVYWILGDFPKALSFIKKSQDLFATIISQRSVGKWILYNKLSIGQVYLEYQRDSARVYLSHYYDATVYDAFWHPVALYSLGDCLFRQGDHVTSLNYVRESIPEAAANEDYFTEAEACAVMSKIFMTMQQPDSAIYYAKKGLAAAKSIRYDFGIYRHSKLLAEEYELSNVDEALHYRKVYDSVNEEMYGANKVQALQKTLVEEQQRQQQIQEEQIKKEDRLKQFGFTAGLVIMLLIAFILYRNNLQKKKANVLLQHQKEKVESTLQELKSTQSQLIQSEKMASLGELTAGIAHEIQNPLNFVNNFSEVNKELIDELQQEARSGNAEEVIAISNDIKDNSEKINLHGKRADAIVKGMLQHSRASSGQKELTDINKLADEYLRLSYHGMRARDKSFNAEYKTDFDETIGKIDVVPQDIGRVLLNLFNNAFYAVSKPPSPKGEQYKPLVTVTTRKIKLTANDVAKSLPLGTGGLEIIVADNGNGIPQNIVDKIFQPFFTTKPTGQGTGLGLSLAYDIIKAHGGEIKVETEQGEYAKFNIYLPLN
jgi:signal transduction histidine kinase